MPRITLVWELGGELGHLVVLSTLANELNKRGHETNMVVRDVARARQIIGDSSSRYLQAPLWQAQSATAGKPQSFADILARRGFTNVHGLQSMVETWRHTFALLQTDTMVLNYAPTAQISARSLSVPTTQVASSFAIPPDTSPFPPFPAVSGSPDRDATAETEAKCLTNINQVLQKHDQQALGGLGELFASGERFITTYPAFDVYGERNNATYVGSLVDNNLGVQPRWPLANGPKIFAYLKPNYPHLDFILTVLGRLKASVIAFVPKFPLTLIKKYQGASLSFATQPIALSEAMKTANFAISNAGVGTIGVCAAAGVPQFLLPMQMEQLMNAKRASDSGCAMYFSLDEPPQILQSRFQAFFSDKDLLTRAKQWAERNQLASLDERLNLVCDSIERSLA